MEQEQEEHFINLMCQANTKFVDSMELWMEKDFLATSDFI